MEPRGEADLRNPGGRRGGFSWSGIAAALSALVLGAWVALPQPAQAVPSFARQTGQPCAACHTAFPELTPFGRRFKLSGYTLEGGDSKVPPLAAMLMPTYTHTEAKQDSPPAPGLKTNDNLVTQQITGFVAGKIYGDLGAFIQVTGNPVTGAFALDASDVRYVTAFKMFGADGFFGVDVNNTPTAEDPWNTVDAWSYPEISSSVAANTIPGTHIDALAQQVAGAGMYVFWNDMLYANFTAYRGLNQNTLEALGENPGPTPDVQNGWQPYWRLSVEKHWGDHYLMIGTVGLYGQTVPGGVFGFGADNYLDVGFDAQYQYDGDKYSVTVKVSDVSEWQKYNASYGQALTSNLNGYQNNLRINASYVWDHTYSLSAGYFSAIGKSDPILWSGMSATNSPNGDGLVFDLAYLPFSHGSPGPYSTANARIGVQYTKYLQLYGGNTNFDGSGLGGTHNASGNNTLFLYAWLAF